MVEVTMNGLREMHKLIEEGDIDVLRTMVKEMAEALMGAEVEALCGAAHGERHPERVNRRNGYRACPWDTRSGSIELALPKLREGSYFPD
jgi:putative transposase